MLTGLKRLITHGNLLLIGAFFLLVACYGVLAVQGPLPFMSPDETATFALSRSVAMTHQVAVTEPRALHFSWLHPRSFVAQEGKLLPVTFPLWSTFLALGAGMGDGAWVLWLAVFCVASFIFPLTWLLEAEWGCKRLEAILISLAVATLPTMVLYGNRSLFGLLPQLALTLWALWLMRCTSKKGWAVFAGIVAALAVGIRPIEGIWVLPLCIGMGWVRYRQTVQDHRYPIVFWICGLLIGLGMVLGLHAYTYGSPWAVGYFLRDLPATVTGATASTVSSAWWRPFFPYGFSHQQVWANLRGMFTLGWWPWMIVWSVAGVGWLFAGWKRATRVERASFLFLIGLTAWLSFYYGQGRYADNIGGQAFHLGSSLFRYLTPVFVGWTVWTCWVLRRLVPSRLARPIFIIFVCLQAVLGVSWAFRDPIDGIFQNRHDREHYATIRDRVEQTASPEMIWISDRSDKVVFPSRAAASPVPALTEIRRFLQVEKQPVWMFRRPPGQQERDQWYAEGLEFVEKERFDRELIYEVRLRAGY